MTSWMVGELGRLMKRTVYVIHNDRKLYTFPSEMAEHDTAIVYNIWGDHFMLYHHTTVGAAAAMLPVTTKKDPPKVKLATRHDAEEPRVRWSSGFLSGDKTSEVLVLYHFLRAKGRAHFLEERLRATYVVRIVKGEVRTREEKDEVSLYERVREFMYNMTVKKMLPTLPE